MKWKARLEFRDPSTLIPYSKNAKVHSKDQIDQIALAISKFGFTQPIVIDGEGVIIAGHGRREAAISLLVKEVPVIVADHLTEDEKIAARIADNKIADAPWDPDMLKFDLATLDLHGFDMNVTGFKLPEIKSFLELGEVKPEMFHGAPIASMSEAPVASPIKTKEDIEAEKEAEKEKEDEVPEPVPGAEPKVKYGEIYLLGEHMLMCGNSTKLEDVERLMGGKIADITLTSPPYNAGCFGYEDGKDKYKGSDDDRSQEEYFNFLTSFIDIALEKSTHVIINNQFLSGNRYALAKIFGRYHNMVKEVFPWIKNTAPPNINPGFFTNRFEFFLCLEKGNSKKGFPVKWQGKFHNVIEGHTAAKDNITDGTHSATMPLYVPEWFLERMEFAKTIYEPFAGSGTTLIACEKWKRQCFAIEKSPQYCDIIITRWEKYSGKKATKLSDGASNNTLAQ